jgi:MinD superfamily P-loop ATPase
MNFIGRMEGPEIQVELKYCERCGGLWLRPQGTRGVYCAGCQACLAAVPTRAETPRQRKRGKARARAVEAVKDVARSGCIENLQGVAEMEVRA